MCSEWVWVEIGTVSLVWCMLAKVKHIIVTALLILTFLDLRRRQEAKPSKARERKEKEGAVLCRCWPWRYPLLCYLNVANSTNNIAAVCCVEWIIFILQLSKLYLLHSCVSDIADAVLFVAFFRSQVFAGSCNASPHKYSTGITHLSLFLGLRLRFLGLSIASSSWNIIVILFWIVSCRSSPLM